MASDIQEVFLQLVRLGVGAAESVDGADNPRLDVKDWRALEDLANEHGLLGVVLDGLDKLPHELRPEQKTIRHSISQMVQSEQQYVIQEHAAAEMALLLHQHGIRTYVLKGAVVAECYPKPEHRWSVDMDCFLADENDSEDVWERGNRVLEEQGLEVRRDFYKNSTVVLPGLMVENHRFLTPFRGNERLKKLERLLQRYLRADRGENRFDGIWLYRPPVMVSALFLIEHAYSHFLHEGLTWRLVLDWQMFSRRHHDEIDWREIETRVNEFGFSRFYDSFCRLGEYLLGELPEDGLIPADWQMLADVWAPLDVHETVTGLKGKLALAGNTWRARWKYRLFAEISWLQALWIQVKGYLFERNPTV